MWALTTRRPNEQFVGLNRIINDTFNTWPFQIENGSTSLTGWLPAVDVSEDEGAVRLTADVPGYRPEKIKASIENQVLTLSGEKENATFRRSFTLPSTVDVERIEATVEHGVLTVTLPKLERAKPREIPVKALA